MANDNPEPFPFPDTVEFDAASLFPDRNFPGVGTTMDLTDLRAALRPATKLDFDEVFIPTRLYVRTEMLQSFNELVSDVVFTKVFSGSPGIGKSILLFLVAIFRAWTEDNRKISYLRYTASENEEASVFAMMSTAAGLVEIRFNRLIRKGSIPELTAYVRSQESFMPQCDYRHNDLRAFVDGPSTKEAHRHDKCRYFCTSGSGLKITNELNGTAQNFVMGGWQRDTIKSAIASQFGLQLDPRVNEGQAGYFDEELFDKIYFVTGGRIRDAMKYYEGKDALTSWADGAVDRISNEAAQLSLSKRDCRSTDSHIDSIRTLFRVPGSATDKVDIIVDSQYMIRCLRSKIDGAEHFDAYHAALLRGLKGAAGVHFEELLHWHLSQEECFPCITSSARAIGKGSEGVHQLTATLMYWIPSIPNFVNIDSAIVGSDGRIWCFQFTIESTHGWKQRRLRTSFVNHIPAIGVRLGDVSIVYVVPSDVEFTAPAIGGEANVVVVRIDCLSMESMRTSLQNMFTSAIDVTVD